MAETDEYSTITPNTGEGFYSEKRSKFYAFAIHVSSEKEAKEHIAEYRRKFYDARHVCFAYTLGPDKSLFRANDDGEPSGTAGKPILGQIVKYGLTDILIIVIRYYGGINLGTGGLTVAYRTAAAEAINNSEIETRHVKEIVEYHFHYPQTNNVMRIVKEMSSTVISINYDSDGCTIRLSIKKSLAKELEEKLKQTKYN